MERAGVRESGNEVIASSGITCAHAALSLFPSPSGPG
jgi:hypothetical protein